MQPGARLGPYEILDPLGTGGMGEVYRARDTRLGRDVAIKVLPASLAADPERVRRFEKEARATGTLNHPNILAIHDVGSHEGSPYLVEELLEGESLAERIRDGDLTAAKVVGLAMQVARGLAAAHGKGVVHRDLKPDNLFVTRDGVVKILDFGLSKLVERPSTADGAVEAPTLLETTEPGKLLGTYPYMSPEQARGMPADHRSDIFSFGVALYEMLAGTRPFGGETASDVISAILKEEAPPLPASVPPALDHLVRRCLEKRPEDRFDSARSLALALEGIATLSPPASAAAVPSHAVSWLQRHRAAAVGLAAVGVMAIAGTVWLWKGRQAPPPSGVDQDRVVVAVFENRTGDASLDTLGVMAADVLTQGLSRTGTLSVALNPSVGLGAGTLPRPATTPGGGSPLEELARETHAGLVVAGAYYLEGQTVRFEPLLVRADGRLLAGLEPVTGPREAPSQLVGALGQRVLGAVASTLDRAIDPSVMRVPSWEAYREFERAMEVFGSDFPETIRRLERVVQIEPSWFFPRYLLFLALTWQARWAEAAQQVDAAAQHEAELTPFEWLVLRSSRAELLGRFEELLATTQEMERQAPDLPWVALNAGSFGLLSNRPHYAIQQMSGLASSIFPGNSEMRSWPLRWIAWSHHNLGEYEDELEAARRGRRAFPTARTFVLSELRALAALGRLDVVDRLLEEALAGQPPGSVPGQVLITVALELRAHGHREASLRMANRAVEMVRALPPEEASKPATRKALAERLWAAERWQEEGAVLDGLAKETPDDLGVMGMVGTLAARRSDRTAALAISERLQRFDRPYLFGEHTYSRACIAAQLGEKDTAVALLRQAVAEGLQVWEGLAFTLHTDIDLEPLHGYPPYEELLKPKG